MNQPVTLSVREYSRLAICLMLSVLDSSDPSGLALKIVMHELCIIYRVGSWLVTQMGA